MTSTNGETHLMDIKDVTALLKATKGTGVKKITIGDMTMEFSDLTAIENSVNTNIKGFNLENNTDHTVPLLEDPEVNVLQNEVSNITEEFTSQYEMLSDPEEFERSLRESLNAS